MLSPRQNLLETIKPDGKPDRFVKQYEAYDLIFASPIKSPFPELGGPPIVNAWGVTLEWPAGTPGPFPVHDQEHIVCKDIEHWRDYVTMPNMKFSDADWEPLVAQAEQVDRNEKFCMICVAPGVFEQTHYLCEIKNALLYLALNPDEMKELIKYIVEFELILAEGFCKYVKPDALLHHDDWGMQSSTFMSPDMFAEFFVEPYKEIYGYYKDHGVELVVHHSDSYAATLVPYMIEMGIDIWQGALDTNNIPELIKNYGGQIAFHGGLNNGIYDVENWDREKVREGLIDLYDSTDGGKYLIAGLCAGGPASTYPGLYEAVDEEIENLSKKYFG